MTVEPASTGSARNADARRAALAARRPHSASS
ncbi:hypothetical protein Lxx01210 [Leifsonia xyli subsp. xyli str. CTCB07]|uniref:Uncharacterized protein n=1 Tax=Leifsonia xyli subsp. xyli (strain CTCB07) TaxID=281090 RepID=Q6AHE1_LEIXX|nr:hypothetical protein Lxx01210 [Leifsonia xyli subsp. xyli str. CTCB07]